MEGTDTIFRYRDMNRQANREGKRDDEAFLHVGRAGLNKTVREKEAERSCFVS